ncbi:hypothetical protein DFH07DRAFT_778808 [Mycena maculata]|uniref:Uncharacterized protein n=1 Tax=Mycena maculata TaxID=230809 RepID=A0AAD7IBG9_9AGAR|nr:hypothetical protein DFH07DRAFT_778808 [Mycena maculata]
MSPGGLTLPLITFLRTTNRRCIHASNALRRVLNPPDYPVGTSRQRIRKCSEESAGEHEARNGLISRNPVFAFYRRFEHKDRMQDAGETVYVIEIVRLERYEQHEYEQRKQGRRLTMSDKSYAAALEDWLRIGSVRAGRNLNGIGGDSGASGWGWGWCWSCACCGAGPEARCRCTVCASWYIRQEKRSEPEKGKRRKEEGRMRANQRKREHHIQAQHDALGCEAAPQRRQRGVDPRVETMPTTPAISSARCRHNATGKGQGAPERTQQEEG